MMLQKYAKYANWPNVSVIFAFLGENARYFPEKLYLCPQTMQNIMCLPVAIMNMTNQIKTWMLAAILLCCSGAQAQTKRSDDFRAKYQLKEVVVMSRHNIRSPLVSGSTAYMRVTPYKWFSWSSPCSQLSLRGGVLETEMGQFFRKWLVGEGLLPDNYRPEGDEVLFYANSRQRTFATAKYFSAGFLPFANVEITHKY